MHSIGKKSKLPAKGAKIVRGLEMETHKCPHRLFVISLHFVFGANLEHACLFFDALGQRIHLDKVLVVSEAQCFALAVLSVASKLPTCLWWDKASRIVKDYAGLLLHCIS